MNSKDEIVAGQEQVNGPGAAAILAAGIGAFTIGLLDIAAEKSQFVKSHFVFYKPTGPLSGVTATAILIWLIAWGVLEWRWRGRNVDCRRVNATAITLLVLGLLLTFPPVVDFL